MFLDFQALPGLTKPVEAGSLGIMKHSACNRGCVGTGNSNGDFRDCSDNRKMSCFELFRHISGRRGYV